MTEPTKDKDKDVQVPESQLDEYTVAYRRLTDLGLTREKDKDKGLEHSYRFSKALVAMVDAVRIIRSHLGRTPEQFQAGMQIKL